MITLFAYFLLALGGASAGLALILAATGDVSWWASAVPAVGLMIVGYTLGTLTAHRRGSR